ncbi:MAG: hypothetical protein CBD03_00445 [Rhizobiales bacterium TMED143]|nr:MAG: hypothetical protein CBD03_00445 [Rhizobiales bacterium TMED143]
MARKTHPPPPPPPSQSPFPRAEGLSVHEIIDPRETRPKLAAWLELAQAAQTDPPEPFMTTMRP